MAIDYPTPITLDTYTDLVTSEHQNAPNYIATIEALVQISVDNQNLLRALPSLFDLDTAIGAQLDRVGERIGRTRYLQTPITDVFFSFNVAGLGFGEGIWFNKFHNPESGLIRLNDESYRTLLRAAVAANQWDGTIQGAYTAWNTVFEPLGFQVLIQSFGNMTMAVAIFGTTELDTITRALFTTGQLDLKPAGVRIVSRLIIIGIPGAPFFGFGIENDMIAGFGTGVWGHSI